MPVLIKTSEMQYKDNLGNYHGVNAIAEKKIADQIADLDEAITAQEDRIDDDIEQMTTDVNEFIDDKTAEITEVLDDYESMADGIVSSAQTAISGIDNQRATMIAAIASVAGQGTDATLTQQGVAADGKAAGDLIAIQSATPSANSTKIWINEDAVDEYTVPTYGEHRTMNMSMLQNDVNAILMASNPYANVFDATATYEVGDYVLVNDSSYNPPMPGSTDSGSADLTSSVVYRCHTAVTTPGAWTGDANWTAVKVMDEVSELKSAINCITDEHISKNLYTGEYTEGGYIADSDGEVYNSESNSYTDFIDVSNISGYITLSCAVSLANTSFRYALYDDQQDYVSGHIIVTSDMSVSGNRYYMAIDITGAKYFRFSTKTTNIELYETTAKFMIEYGSTPTSYEKYFAPEYKLKTDFIDDTAGDGDSDKTWSADKLYDEFDRVDSSIDVLEPTASNSDIGKALIVKTVSNSKVTEYEFGEAGGGGGVTIDDTAGAGVTNKAWSANKLANKFEDVDYLKDVQEHTVSVTKTKNLYDGEYTEHGYIGDTDGIVYTSPTSTYSYTDYIEIGNSSGYITISCKVDLKQSFRYALYDEEKEYITGHIIGTGDMSTSGGRYYLPVSASGAKYIRFSDKTTNISLYTTTAKFMIEFGNTPTSYEAYVAPSYKVIAELDNNELKIAESMTLSSVPQKDLGFSMSDGTLKSLETNNIKKNYSLFFFGKITTFDEVWIGHGTGSNGYYFVIDDTHVTPTQNGSSGSALSHSLTIEDYIALSLIVESQGKATIMVNTKGGSYSRTFDSGFGGTKGDIFVKSSGSTFTECNFGWACNDYKKRTWVFGDSYLGQSSNKRWPYWMITWGYNNALLSGYPGENSENAYADFLQALTHGTPKYLIWCLGMNDQDSSSAISTSYQTYVELVMAKCEELGITLILATIPDVTANPGGNDYKNAYVRASGYRYIDFADAVDGIDDWLDTDETHPNEVGARLLCSAALSAVPELMLES